jgi:uncharacterized cupredoxin-like copper-binding protein
MHPAEKLRTVAAVSVIALSMSACATGPSSPSPTGVPSATAAAGASTIQVTLQEWAVVPVTTSVAAGDVTFQVTNTGPEDVHEFVVLKTDLAPAALPTDARGAVTETGTGIEVVDEIEDIAVGAAQDLTVTLEAGKYVLLCNIYDETEKEAHYKMGMRTPFEVTS